MERSHGRRLNLPRQRVVRYSAGAGKCAAGGGLTVLLNRVAKPLMATDTNWGHDLTGRRCRAFMLNCLNADAND